MFKRLKYKIDKLREPRFTRKQYFQAYLNGLQNIPFECEGKMAWNLTTWFTKNYTVHDLEFSHKEGLAKHPTPYAKR